MWIKFPDKADYEEKIEGLLTELADSDGRDSVVLYIDKEKVMKKLPPNRNVNANEALEKKLAESYGPENIKIVWDVKKD